MYEEAERDCKTALGEHWEQEGGHDPVLAGGLQGQRGYELDQQDPGW